jgi:hypothetical protein
MSMFAPVCGARVSSLSWVRVDKPAPPPRQSTVKDVSCREGAGPYSAVTAEGSLSSSLATGSHMDKGPRHPHFYNLKHKPQV